MKNKKTILIIFLVIVIVFVFFGLMKNKILKIMYPKDYKNLVLLYEEQYNVDENLIYAVIKAESNFKSDVVSNKGAVGLMQLMEETAKDVARKNNIQVDFDNMKDELKKDDINIKIGVKYLQTLLEKYKNTVLIGKF